MFNKRRRNRRKEKETKAEQALQRRALPASHGWSSPAVAQAGRLPPAVPALCSCADAGPGRCVSLLALRPRLVFRRSPFAAGAEGATQQTWTLHALLAAAPAAGCCQHRVAHGSKAAPHQPLGIKLTPSQPAPVW